MWKTAYIKQDIVNRFRLAKTKELVKKQFANIKKYSQSKRLRKTRVNKGLARYILRLCASSIIAF